MEDLYEQGYSVVALSKFELESCLSQFRVILDNLNKKEDRGCNYYIDVLQQEDLFYVFLVGMKKETLDFLPSSFDVMLLHGVSLDNIIYNITYISMYDLDVADKKFYVNLKRSFVLDDLSILETIRSKYKTALKLISTLSDSTYKEVVNTVHLTVNVIGRLDRQIEFLKL